jgi:hypothetical protein
MYLYLDETGIDGKSELVYVGGVYSDIPIFKNIIKNKIKKYIRNPKIKDELKYSDRSTKQNIKDKIIKDIKKVHKSITHSEKFSSDTTLNIILKLIIENIISVYKKEKCKKSDKFFVYYDKTRLKIDTETILNKTKETEINFPEIVFEMLDSKNSAGIQIADWIVGDSRVNKKY